MTPSLLADLAALAASHAALLVLLVKATLILVTALGTTLAMQRASAGARHLVWLVTLATLLLMPALSAWGPLRIRVLPPTSVTVLPVTSASRAMERTPAASSNRAARDAADSRAVHPAANASVASPKETSAAAQALEVLGSMSRMDLLVTAWAIVAFLILCSLAWAGIAVNRIVARAQPLDGRDWLDPFYEVSDRLGLDAAPRLLVSRDARMPFACGMATPTIVLPAECEGWTLDRRRAVLLHELAHVKRYDLIGHSLGRVVCALYWFHPLAWTAAKQLRNESERACDDLALSCGTRAADYAEHLLDIVTSVRFDSTPSVALAMARRKEFEGRMLAILDPELRHSALSRRQSASLIGALALIALTVGAIAPTARAADAAVLDARASTAWGLTSASPTVRGDTVQSPLRRDTTDRTRNDAVGRRDDAVAGRDDSVSRRDDAVTRNESSQPSLSRADARALSRAITHDLPELTHEAMREAVQASDHESTRESIRAATSAHTATPRTDSIISSLNIAVGELATSTTISVMQGLIGDRSARRGSAGSDDRPVLLAKVLRSDTSATLRRVAAWGLREYVNTPAAMEALAAALKGDASAVVREMAAWSLSSSDHHSIVVTEALGSALRSDANERVRATSAWSLGRGGDRAATLALTTGLADANESVRLRAAWALGNVEPKQAPKALLDLLRDKDVQVRQLAAWALYRIEDPGAAPALEAALKAETDKDTQLAEIRALASLGEKSVDALRSLIESPDARVRTMAVRALAGGHATGPWPWPWPDPRPSP